MATPGLDLKLLPGADGQNSDQRHWPANGGEGLAPHLTTRPDEAPAATQWSDRVGDRPERCRARSRCMRLSCCLLFCGCRHRNRRRPSRSKSRSCWTRMRRLVNSLAPRLRQTKASQRPNPEPDAALSAQPRSSSAQVERTADEETPPLPAPAADLPQFSEPTAAAAPPERPAAEDQVAKARPQRLFGRPELSHPPTPSERTADEETPPFPLVPAPAAELPQPPEPTAAAAPAERPAAEDQAAKAWPPEAPSSGPRAISPDDAERKDGGGEFPPLPPVPAPAAELPQPSEPTAAAALPERPPRRTRRRRRRPRRLFRDPPQKSRPPTRAKGRRTKRPLRSRRSPRRRRNFLNFRSRPPQPRPRSAPPQRTRRRRRRPRRLPRGAPGAPELSHPPPTVAASAPEPRASGPISPSSPAAERPQPAAPTVTALAPAEPVSPFRTSEIPPAREPRHAPAATQAPRQPHETTSPAHAKQPPRPVVAALTKPADKLPKSEAAEKKPALPAARTHHNASARESARAPAGRAANQGAAEANRGASQIARARALSHLASKGSLAVLGWFANQLT